MLKGENWQGEGIKWAYYLSRARPADAVYTKRSRLRV